MIQLHNKPIANSWIKADWDTYVNTVKSRKCEKHRSYYHIDRMRIEDLFVGADVARSKPIIYFAIISYGMSGLINCSYQTIGIRECQPAISFYVGNKASPPPTGKSVVNLNEQAIPNLVIEISNTTLEDDLGAKRLLYEEMGISEYWVVDVQNSLIYAFEMFDGGASPSEYRGSKRIDTSIVLPGLSIETIITALNLSKEQDQSQIGKWLMSQFQG
jgi:hypothetical protein